MATNATPVTADQKDEPGVQVVVVTVPGVGEVETYIKVETTDDLDGKTTKGVETFSLSAPAKAEREVIELDAEGDPVLNEDGSKKVSVEVFWETKHFEVDLSPSSLSKLSKALEPFLKNAREKEEVTEAPSLPKARQSSTADPAEVRRWAKENEIKVNGKPINEMGRVPRPFIDLFLETHS